MIILGIDPGSSSGALCRFDTEGQEPTIVENMPDTALKAYRRIYTLAEEHMARGCHIVMEDVGGTRPGNSAKSARTFAEHCGALRLTLDILTGYDQITRSFVLPRKWMYELFGKSYPSGSANLKARKKYIYDHMRTTLSGVPFTERQADAVAIAWWAYKTGVASRV